MPTHKAVFDAKVDEVPAICETLTAAARSLGMDEDHIWKLEVSLDEACTNIACYGYHDQPDGKIWIQWQRTNGSLVIDIEDAGVPFDQTLPTKPDFKSDLCKRKPGGLGRFIIHEFMDEFSYQRKNGHNVIRLKKKLKAAPVMQEAQYQAS